MPLCFFFNEDIAKKIRKRKGAFCSGHWSEKKMRCLRINYSSWDSRGPSVGAIVGDLYISFSSNVVQVPHVRSTVLIPVNFLLKKNFRVFNVAWTFLSMLPQNV